MRRRAARVAALLVAVMMLWACGTESVTPPPPREQAVSLATATRTVAPATVTPAPPTPTNTPVPPTDTAVPPTGTPVPPTSTPAHPTDTPVPPTNTPAPPTHTKTATATRPAATATKPAAARVVIVAVDKRAEYVDIKNSGGTAQDLAGWVLVSEKGNQRCALGGTLGPGEALRIWAMEKDRDRGGFNCGFGTTIWNNDEKDPAVLLDAAGREVDRK